MRVSSSSRGGESDESGDGAASREVPIAIRDELLHHVLAAGKRGVAIYRYKGWAK